MERNFNINKEQDIGIKYNNKLLRYISTWAFSGKVVLANIFEFCSKHQISNFLFNRSEDMTLFQLRVPKDDAWDVMNQLGDLDVAHFINLNKNEQPFNLPYAN
jgi:hypothetical protein